MMEWERVLRSADVSVVSSATHEPLTRNAEHAPSLQPCQARQAIWQDPAELIVYKKPTCQRQSASEQSKERRPKQR